MHFRTKREAEEAAHDRERRARQEDDAADGYEAEGAWECVPACRRGATDFRREAARIRALLPALPE